MDAVICSLDKDNKRNLGFLAWCVLFGSGAVYADYDAVMDKFNSSRSWDCGFIRNTIDGVLGILSV